MDKKKVILVILTILLVLGGVGAGVYLVQQEAEIREKAAPATTLALTSDNTSPQVGESVTVNIEINTGENQIPGVELYLSFDASKLEAQAVSPGTFFSNPQAIGPNIDNVTGTIYYVLWILPGSTPKQGQGTLATVVFSTKNVGSAQVSFDSSKTVVGAVGETGGGGEFDRVNALVDTTPITINILGETLPTNTPTPTDDGGIGRGSEPTSTPIPTPTNTPAPTSTTSSGGDGDTTTTPTVTPEIPPIPDSGISLPTLGGLAIGVFIILGALLLAF